MARYQVSYFIDGRGIVGHRDIGKISDVWRARRTAQRLADMTQRTTSFRVYAYTSPTSECLSSKGSVMFFETEPLKNNPTR